MSGFHHASLAGGRWQELSLYEQMGNIGSEIGRARIWEGKDEESFTGAVYRALELIDLTIADPRWRYRLKEILRARELVCDAFTGGKEYGTTWKELDEYFFPFAYAARKER